VPKSRRPDWLVHVQTILAISFQLLPYFFQPVVNALCLSCVHLPLFIFIFKKVTSATCADQMKAGSGQQMAMASDDYAQ
jgi:hypothetical protein